jgi:hypothetical protein
MVNNEISDLERVIDYMSPYTTSIHAEYHSSVSRWKTKFYISSDRGVRDSNLQRYDKWPAVYRIQIKIFVK